LTSKPSGWRIETGALKFHISIQSRLVLSITLLVGVLFGSVLFVIQRREVRTLYEETMARATLVAQYMADMNLQPLKIYDQSQIQASVDARVSEQLPYIVFYDRSGTPFVANAAAKSDLDILGRSHFDDDVGPGTRFTVSRRVKVQDHWLRVLELEIPIFSPGEVKKWASIKIGHSLEPMYADIREVRLVLILIGMGGVGLGILGATVLANRITRPIKKLVDGTIRISHGDFSHSIDVPSGDEISDLAGSFNEMSRQLLQMRERMEAANRKLVQAEKLASIGRLSATIAHEIRNPLTSVKLNIQKVAEDETLAVPEKEHLSISMEGIGQIEKFIKELLSFTRAADLVLERYSPVQIVEESLKLLQQTFDQKRIFVERRYAAGLPPVLVDGDKMRQVVLNVLRNAQEAMAPGGRISLTVDTTEVGGQTKVRFRISDNGPGIPEKDWDNIFEPFFTTKPSGFGLGLANARKIVEQHNGTIRLAKKRGQGSLFVILIPAEEGT
jgi:signal transduction histidine kinase